jgi:hypothetical protein
MLPSIDDAYVMRVVAVITELAVEEPWGRDLGRV